MSNFLKYKTNFSTYGFFFDFAEITNVNFFVCV